MVHRLVRVVCNAVEVLIQPWAHPVVPIVPRVHIVLSLVQTLRMYVKHVSLEHFHLVGHCNVRIALRDCSRQ